MRSSGLEETEQVKSKMLTLAVRLWITFIKFKVMYRDGKTDFSENLVFQFPSKALSKALQAQISAEWPDLDIKDS